MSHGAHVLTIEHAHNPVRSRANIKSQRPRATIRWQLVPLYLQQQHQHATYHLQQQWSCCAQPAWHWQQGPESSKVLRNRCVKQRAATLTTMYHGTFLTTLLFFTTIVTRTRPAMAEQLSATSRTRANHGRQEPPATVCNAAWKHYKSPHAIKISHRPTCPCIMHNFTCAWKLYT